MDYQSTKDYWEERAREFDVSIQATTMDVYMREIEIRVLKTRLKQLKKSDALKVADIGCGNGYATIELAKDFPQESFFGYDYSEKMIESANKLKDSIGLKNIDFQVFDFTSDELMDAFDVIITDRCLINLPSWEAQKRGLMKISDSLKEGGSYLMIENFHDGHQNFNDLRKKFALNEIKIRDHNFFLNKDKVLNFLSGQLRLNEFINISSQYYIFSRIIYSKICQINEVDPDYYDIHHALASQLPFEGNAGPISFLHLKKNNQ